MTEQARRKAMRAVLAEMPEPKPTSAEKVAASLKRIGRAWAKLLERRRWNSLKKQRWKALKQHGRP